MRSKHAEREHGEPNPRTDHLSRLGYESRDVVIPVLVKWIGYLFLFIFGSFAITFGVYKLFVPQGGEEARSLPLTTVQRQPVPGAPVLQVHPKRDMIEFRREELQKLNGYGWVDQSKGVAKIPVDRAIDIVVERGIPAPQGPGSVGGVLGPPPMGLPGSAAGTQGRNQSQPR